jgi:hypothetical protein
MPIKPVRPRRKSRKSSEWKVLISEYESSGMVPSSFCKKHDVSRSVFDKWKFKFSNSKPTKFIPISRANRLESLPSVSQCSSALKISISDKFIMEFPSGCEINDLLKIIPVLKQCC